MDATIIGSIIGVVGSIAGAATGVVLAREPRKRVGELERSIREVAEVLPTIPAEFAEEAAFIRGIKIFRRNFVTTFSFQELPAGGLEVEITVAFTVVNCTSDEYVYEHRLELLPDQKEEHTRILRMAARGSELKGEYEQRFRDAEKPVLEFHRRVRVPPNGKNPNNRFEAKFRRLARVDDAEVIFLTSATLTKEVHVERRPDDLEVAVEFSHRLSSEAQTIPAAAAQPTLWRLERAFLPWQSVSVRWNKKAPST